MSFRFGGDRKPSRLESPYLACTRYQAQADVQLPLAEVRDESKHRVSFRVT